MPDSIVTAQLGELLARLEQDRERRCSAELASATERARAIVRAARSEARNRMQAAVRYERLRLDEALALRRAEIDAARSREERAALQALVRRACDELPAALERRWNEPGTRREWCEVALAMAAQRLCGPDWTIELAAGTSREEREGLLARAGALRAGSHTLSERPELKAGLSVRAAGATLDATIGGLLDDVAAVGAHFLAEWLSDEARAGARAVPS
jgi:hypothetical protein